MHWSEKVNEYIAALKPITIDAAVLQRLWQLLDLTTLNDNDTEASVAAFLAKAKSTYGNVAAVCVYPTFARLVADEFAGTPVKTAVVANFPAGETSLENVLIEINQALEAGANEIDVVFPYSRYLAGERHYAESFVQACKAACGKKALLKVILETGALLDPEIIADASYDALASGADFIKTSTGKISEGATLEAVAVMLMVIKHISPKLDHPVGCKISGGVREIEQAVQYVELANLIMGREWVTPETFRIGASKLADEILKRKI